MISRVNAPSHMGPPGASSVYLMTIHQSWRNYKDRKREGQSSRSDKSNRPLIVMSIHIITSLIPVDMASSVTAEGAPLVYGQSLCSGRFCIVDLQVAHR